MNRLLTILIAVLCLTFAAGSVQAAPPAPGVNIVLNGDFSQSFNSWTISAGSTWDLIDGVLFIDRPTAGALNQHFTYTASTGDPYEVKLLMGNTYTAARNVGVRLADGVTNQLNCTFSVPANSALQSYRMVGQAPGAWTAIDLFIIPAVGTNPHIIVDQVDVRYISGSQVGTTPICTAPATPTPTYTPTATYTPSPTATATPALALTWALPTQVINGTPQPAQYVEFSHEMTAGDVGVSILLFALLIVLVSVFVIWLLIGRNRRVD